MQVIILIIRSNSNKQQKNLMDADPVHGIFTDPPVAGENEEQKLSYKIALQCGYTESDLKLIPPEARSGLGCGNAVSAADLKQGELVLSLGCGASMDLFLAAEKVQPGGRAVGVDHLETMVDKMMGIAKKYKRENIEFYYSLIEEMPFPEHAYHVVISNCVMNLVPDKTKAFNEIHRVLKSGGRLIISDILIKKKLPEELEKELADAVGFVGTAIDPETYKTLLESVGFHNISITDKKLDLVNLYKSHKARRMFCGGKKSGKVDTHVLDKYNLNEYAMSGTIVAFKKQLAWRLTHT
eukprot:TRINITY_DN681_c0_g1_i1.p3 TRINITY_DN681_c0_g1~~TRINITY_DN681_c0_g1_i1.p3  ORF type:complete len:296 (+),score=29.58 TRINITY_DN681_c0_g1_i1:1281-2168(+)